MGKRAKEHRKKVKVRNQKIEHQKTRLQKLYTKLLDEKIKELKQKYSAETETNISEDESVQIQPESGSTIS